MPITYTQIYIQLVFSVKHRESLIASFWKDELCKHITGTVQNNKSKMLAVNGMPDHMHVFIGYKPTVSIPDLVKDIKVSSSLFVNDKKLAKGKFAWQEGYGAFSYSLSQIDRVCKYVMNQELHHKKLTFREEYTKFLKGFKVEYEDKYLFEFFDGMQY